MGAWNSVKSTLKAAGVYTPATSFNEEEERRRREAEAQAQSAQALYNSYADEVDNAGAFGSQSAGGFDTQSSNGAFGSSGALNNEANSGSAWQRAQAIMKYSNPEDYQDPVEELREFIKKDNARKAAEKEAAERRADLEDKLSTHSQGKYTSKEVAAAQAGMKDLGLTDEQRRRGY